MVQRNSIFIAALLIHPSQYNEFAPKLFILVQTIITLIHD